MNKFSPLTEQVIKNHVRIQGRAWGRGLEAESEPWISGQDWHSSLGGHNEPSFICNKI